MGLIKLSAILLLSLVLDAATAEARCNAPTQHQLQQALQLAQAHAWADAVAAFAAVSDADADCGPARWDAASLDRLQYAELQTGRDDAAKALAALGDGRTRAIMAARYALERDAWGEAAGLPLPVDADPESLAILRYARALGAIRNGQAPTAAADIAALNGSAAEVAKAWVALAEGRKDAAIAAMRDAADREDADTAGGPAQNPLLPYRELLADMLFESDDFTGAVREYETSLRHAPARMRAYWGAGRAAESAGDRERTRRYYGDFAALCEAATCLRPGRLTALKRSMAPP